MVTRTIQKNHRISIPPEIWSSLGLREGDEVEILRHGGRIIVIPASSVEKPTETLWNLSESPTPTDSPDEVIERGVAREAQE